MQQLHLIGLTTDHTGLILSARRGAKTGKYSVVADDKLLAALKEAQRIRDGGDPADGAEPAIENPPVPSRAAVGIPPTATAKRTSSLSPREIQARLRAGGSVREIAAVAGVDEEWILRFADPIRAEQARVVERAQGFTFNKPRHGLSAEPLEKSVQLNLAERGVRLPADVFATAWTAFNLHGTSWAVLFSFNARQRRRQSAQWEVDLRSGELLARNRLASDLAYLEPGRRRRRLEPLEVPTGDDDLPVPRRPATKAVPARKAPPANNKAVAKNEPVKKRPVAKKVAAARNAPVARKAAARKGGRQSSPRGGRPAKKPAAKTPAPQTPAAAVPSASALPERTTHLARPPSPMNLTNRSITQPGRLVGAPSLRTRPPPPARARAQAPRGRSRPEESPARQAGPRFELEPEPTSTESSSPPPARAERAERPPERNQDDEPRARARRRRSERRISPRVGEQPAVVILSTPAVRRLDSEEKGASRTPAQRS
ncbi:MAG: septation protein SepH [Acidimicrobiales bacterium]